MPYADQGAVATWTQNIENQPGDLFTQASALCDAQIDADLGNYFQWPDLNDAPINDPPPVYIKQMANILTASIVENMAYSQMQSRGEASMDDTGGFGGSTYGRMLYGMYKNMLSRIIRGQALVATLVRYGSIAMIPSGDTFRLQVGLAYDNAYGNTAESTLTVGNNGTISVPIENPGIPEGAFDTFSNEA